MPLKITKLASSIVVHLKVVPGASRTKIMGLLGDQLKIAISKPPSGGAANKEVIEVLADLTGVPARQINIIAGQTNPRKQVQINSITSETFLTKLAEAGIEL